MIKNIAPQIFTDLIEYTDTLDLIINYLGILSIAQKLNGNSRIFILE